MRDKKSQMEIMGLAVIIVIIIFGILLALIFLKPKDSTLESDITDSTLASNMLNVILRTQLECKPTTMKEVLKDCMNRKEDVYCIPNVKEKACDVAEEIIGTNILGETLEVWGKKYTFKVDDIQGNNIVTISNTPDDANGEPICRLGSRKFASIIAETYPINEGGQKMEATLFICS